MVVLPVASPDGQYDIQIEPGLLRELPRRQAEFGLTTPSVLAANTVVGGLYGSHLANAMASITLVTFPEGEAYKNLQTVAQLYPEFVRAGLDRSGTVIALGGGVTGDMTGFAAATYMRGVRLVQIPTTLLSMVDSSVGGKVGVDLPEGKNLVGAFKQPAVVLIDPSVLETLPEREIRCGMAELIKHGLIAHPDLLERALRLHTPPNWLNDHSLNPRAYFDGLAKLIPDAIQVKIDIVQADPYEHGIRAYLNLGHTFGHAIEQVSGYIWPHGEAVGAGLMAAALLSRRLGLCDDAVVQITRDALRAVSLPERIPGLDPDSVFAAMATDKKWREGRPRFVLLRGIGEPEIVEGVSRQDVLAVLTSLCDG
ncbi:MAG: 3-dehydroquinate synthase [Anaerolineae bacterium]|nr:3-dehydroquinate synthase [Anaerolineae bacterium]